MSLERPHVRKRTRFSVLHEVYAQLSAQVLMKLSRHPSPVVRRSSPSPNTQMELPDPIQNFIHPTPGGEEGQSAALAAGAAREVAKPSGLRLRSTRQEEEGRGRGGRSGRSPLRR